jgi:hypothetical protein
LYCLTATYKECNTILAAAEGGRKRDMFLLALIWDERIALEKKRDSILQL